MFYKLKLLIEVVCFGCISFCFVCCCFYFVCCKREENVICYKWLSFLGDEVIDWMMSCGVLVCGFLFDDGMI